MPGMALSNAVDQRMTDAIRASSVRPSRVADALGLSRQAVSDRLHGRTRYVAAEVPVIAALLGITVAELLGEDR